MPELATARPQANSAGILHPFTTIATAPLQPDQASGIRFVTWLLETEIKEKVGVDFSCG